MALLTKFWNKSVLIILSSLFAGQQIASAQEVSSVNNLNYGSELFVQSEFVKSEIQKQLQIAKEQQDLLKTLCLNDKLQQVNIAIAAMRESKFDLKMALNKKDAALAEHKFIIISILKQKIDQFLIEASKCSKYEINFLNKSSVKSSIDQSIPLSPDSLSPIVQEVIIQPAICSSCYK